VTIRLKAFQWWQPATEYRLVEPRDMLANKNAGKVDDWSLLVDMQRRLPVLPELRPYPPELTHSLLLEGLRKSRGQLAVTDNAFWQLQLQLARAEAEEKATQVRRQEDIQADAEAAKGPVENELRRRQAFFRAAYEILVTNDKATAKARKLEFLYNNMVRGHRFKEARAWRDETLRLIDSGFQRDSRFWAWRLDNLWARSPNGGLVKLKGHGALHEAVSADIEYDHRRHVTAQNHQWHMDNLYVTQPNGALRPAHSMTGKPREVVEAQKSLTDRRLTSDENVRIDNNQFDILRTKTREESRMAMRDIRKSLAGHDIQASLFQQHVLTPLDVTATRLAPAPGVRVEPTPGMAPRPGTKKVS